MNRAVQAIVDIQVHVFRFCHQLLGSCLLLAPFLCKENGMGLHGPVIFHILFLSMNLIY